MKTPPERVTEVMTKRPITIAPDIELDDALEIMRSWGMRHLPVTEDKKIVGLLSIGDIFRTKAIKGSDADLLVRDAMSPKPFVVKPNETLAKVTRVMAENKYGCAIVERAQGEVVGIFTTTDALWLLSQILSGPEPTRYNIMSIDEFVMHRATA